MLKIFKKMNLRRKYGRNVAKTKGAYRGEK
jgi:hypothetical protein